MVRFAEVPLAVERFVHVWRRRSDAGDGVSIRDATVRARAVVRALDEALMETEIAAARAETTLAAPTPPTRATGPRPQLRATLVTLRGDLRQLDALAADEAKMAHAWTNRAGLASEEGRADLAAIAYVRHREHARFAEALAVEAHAVARTVSKLEHLLEAPPAQP